MPAEPGLGPNDRIGVRVKMFNQPEAAATAGACGEIVKPGIGVNDEGALAAEAPASVSRGPLRSASLTRNGKHPSVQADELRGGQGRGGLRRRLEGLGGLGREDPRGGGRNAQLRKKPPCLIGRKIKDAAARAHRLPPFGDSSSGVE